MLLKGVALSDVHFVKNETPIRIMKLVAALNIDLPQ